MDEQRRPSAFPWRLRGERLVSRRNDVLASKKRGYRLGDRPYDMVAELGDTCWPSLTKEDPEIPMNDVRL